MGARERLAHAASELPPFKQGGLDGLCGLYSIVNAIALALYPRRLAKAEAIHLFDFGAKSLAQRDLLTPAIVGGVTTEEWNALIDELAAEANQLTQSALTVRRPLATIGRLTAPIIRLVVRDALGCGRPVLLSLDKAYDHFTVAAAYSASRVILFDSGAGHWINWSSLTARGQRHRVERQGLVVVFENEKLGSEVSYVGR